MWEKTFGKVYVRPERVFQVQEDKPSNLGLPNKVTRGTRKERMTAMARVYSFTPVDVEASNDVVTSTLSLFSHHASILFDSRATHSFISNHYAPLAEKIPEPLEPSMFVAMPSRELIICDSVLIGCSIEIQGRILLANLIIFNLSGFDMILGMDWLSWNHACVDCFNKRKSEDYKLDGYGEIPGLRFCRLCD
ncbi:uncharacterized protein LOC118348194 [Juglans regia]|uniref:Uncharacterized protein LOC118348194 n=1 Tax=Juglans regia TaxID=51240 RepID=A0A6P9ECP9_JUGRE|nr:uncharacterized protein LOC118348194 [Juglans regia]